MREQTLYDMHCHIDFADNAQEIAKESASAGIYALDATVMPSSYSSAMERLEPFSNIKVSLGLHPWWISEGRVTRADVSRFEQYAYETPYIGEIGLDYAHGSPEMWSRQLDTFDHLLKVIDDAGSGKLIVMHVVKAYYDAFRLMERHRTFEENICVFHWFQGNREDLTLALSKGAYFSIGPRMLSGEKGRHIAKSVPNERLLLETDAPSHEGMEFSCEEWRSLLDHTVGQLADIRETDASEIGACTVCNSVRLLQFPE